MSENGTFFGWFFRGKKRKESDLTKDNGLRVIIGIMLFGFFSLLVISLCYGIRTRTFNGFFGILGLSGVVGLAATVVGGLLGFIFGIPRSLQRGDELHAGSSERPYSNNTNLEQISDWLTKIIVGVGLTQLPQIEQRFHQLTLSVSNGFAPVIDSKYAYPFSSGIIIFYTICGFLSVYIWAKIYFLQQLNDLEISLNRKNFAKVVEKASRRSLKFSINQLENLLTDFNRRKNRVLETENQPEYKIVVETAKPGPIRYIEDCQKERWGGKSVAGGYKIDAGFQPNIESSEDNCLVTLEVTPVEPNTPLTGMVYFFLHDSFYQEYIKKVEAADNKAIIQFPSFEAFTVGVVLNEGQVKLELDLNTLANCPTDYHYSSDLITVDDITSELKKLEEEQAAQVEEDSSSTTATT